jgi:large exoprotein involved in heme utilization and adhesion
MPRSYPKKHALALAVGLALALDASAQTVSSTALPTGGTVVGGQAAIATQGAAMTVEQSSARTAIDWQSFNIGSQASVTFHQPSASAIALNRVLGSSGSEDYGHVATDCLEIGI